MELRDAIRSNRMTGFQWNVVAICILLTVIDGYEILISAFTLPALIAHWDLSLGEAGLVASIGTLGMGIGAVVLSPLADRVGRRRMIIFSLVLIVIGMSLSGSAQSFDTFLMFRFFAGLFLGGIVPSINVLVAEYASDAKRGTVMGIYGVGLPAGAALGGFLSIELIDQFTWRGPYFFSAGLTLLMLGWVVLALPESVDYLVEKRPRGALALYNRIGAKIGVPHADALPAPVAAVTRPSLGKDVFQGIMLRRTLLLWISYGLLIASFYFANGLTAKLVAQSTGNADIGIKAQALVAVGGVIGALLFAAFSSRLHPRLVTCLVMVFGFFAFYAFAQFFENSSMVFVLAVLIGISVNGGVAAYYAISPPIYPTTIRASAVGMMMGFGRIVAFMAPNIATFLEGRGLLPPDLYRLYGGILIVAAIAVLALHRTYRGANALDAMETEAKLATEKLQSKALA